MTKYARNDQNRPGGRYPLAITGLQQGACTARCEAELRRGERERAPGLVKMRLFCGQARMT